MTKYTRGEFLGMSALLAGASACDSWSLAEREESKQIENWSPELLLINAKVYTVDDEQPRAEAFAVRGGRFVAVGSTNDVRNLRGSNTQVIDAEGMTVVPGFIDTHCHPSGVNELYGVNLDLRSIEEISIALRQKVSSTPPNYWIDGFKFDDTKLNDGRPLHRKDLDQISLNHPVSVAHRGGHTNWYNSKAFELAGITKNTPDPLDGRFERDEDGELSGMVAERARDVFDTVGEREEFTAEQERERKQNGMAHISKLLTATGLTTGHDAAADRGKILAYEDTYRKGDLRHRAYIMVRGMLEAFKTAGIYTGFGNEWVRIGGVKFTADGSASERTMRMSTPFIGKPDDYGILIMSQQEIHEVVEDAHRHGFQVGIHANGDVTIEMVLNAYERVLKKWPRADRRHRIEHCSLVNPSLLARIKATGTVPTPFWTYVHYHGEKWKEYGDEKMRWMFAHRSFLDYGIPVPGASDYTPGPFAPLMAMQSMVTRKDVEGREWGGNQKITVDEALRIATINGARASYEEQIKGSITAGKLADFVMLERDPHDEDPDQIKHIGVVRTVVGGRTMYRMS